MTETAPMPFVEAVKAQEVPCTLGGTCCHMQCITIHAAREIAAATVAMNRLAAAIDRLADKTP